MKKQSLISLTCASVAVLISACTGDSLQPTASQNAFTPQNASAGTQRPISDFVTVQGKHCIQGTSTSTSTSDCYLFAPPTNNYLVWYSQAQNVTALVDYAGIVDQWVQEHSTASSSTSSGTYSLGTQTYGTVTEQPMSDGRVQVTVELRTLHANITIYEGSDPRTGRPMFGYRPEVLVDGMRSPALGEAYLRLTFINTAPGMPLPDLVQLLKSPEPGQMLISSEFRFEGEGEARDASGRRGRAHVVLTGQGSLMPGMPGMEQSTAPMGYANLQMTPA